MHSTSNETIESFLTEDDIIDMEHKLSEYRRLKNTLIRYHRRIMRLSLEEANHRGLKIYSTDSHIHPVYDIAIKRKGDEIIDDSQLLALAADKYPSFHRRYLNLLEKRKQLEAVLDDFLSSY